MPRTSPALSSVLPPLICGTAAFNSLYNPDPYALSTSSIIHRAFTLGIRAFDTSPYYGPSEELLGKALNTPFIHENFPRRHYFLLTKVGRIADSEFDYSPEWVRYSIHRSLKRMVTTYLDVVYCHDVEFVTAAEVLAAVRELRRIRDEEGSIRYIGISGYPVPLLCELAEMILRETGEPLDAVMSYANFTLQNTTLSSTGVPRFRDAGVDVVPNASMLGMGLLRRSGVPVGGKGDWHPAEEGLRRACREASEFCDKYGEKIECVAIRYAVENWIQEGSSVGSRVDPASGVPIWQQTTKPDEGRRFGVSVIGCSTVAELEETMRLWYNILDGLEGGEQIAIAAGRWKGGHEWSVVKKKEILILAAGIKEVLGKWVGFAWPSPGPGYVNVRTPPAREAELRKESGIP
jgi:D-arabinose 1-dehydrogenase